MNHLTPIARLSERVETKAIIINYPEVAACVRELGGIEVKVPNLLSELQLDRCVRRVVHQIHVVADSAGLCGDIHNEFVKAGANIHRANAERTDCLVFLHAQRMAELFDVVAIVVADAGFLPLLRHMKTLGCRVELHVLPTADSTLLWAADERVGLYPPGSPIRNLQRVSAAA
jgi:hypothetical protein